MDGTNRQYERAAARMMCVGFDGFAVTGELRSIIARGVRSVILFSRNYQTPQQLAELCCEIKSLSREPILICTDHEGGRVQRFREPFTRIPSMRQLGSTGDIALAREIGRTMARELRAVNIDLNLAPVLDVDSNPNNPVIGNRALGSDPERVARLGCALIDGLQNSPAPHLVGACGKHFPGHGDTNLDSHHHLPHLNHDFDRLNRVELPPFIAAIKTAVASIMVSHVLFEPLDSRLPASMSEAIVNGLLREQLGFDGVVISDDLEMKAIADHFGINDAVIRGAIAGVDLFCICQDSQHQQAAIAELARATRNGQVPRGRLQQSAVRFDQLVERYVQAGKKWSPENAAVFAESTSSPRVGA